MYVVDIAVACRPKSTHNDFCGSDGAKDQQRGYRRSFARRKGFDSTCSITSFLITA
jgi:hypothetical protein